jgi:3-deoxy-7-phosphoheptulonate synthase
MNAISDIDDVHVRALKTLVPPAVLMEEISPAEASTALVLTTRTKIENILQGKDDRLIVVVGPCSIHDPAAALDYARQLAAQKTELESELLIVMRVYFEKPRTTVGWKGLINDPNLDGSFDINHGLRTARKLLLNLADMGLPAGCEFLDTISPQFFADLVSWGAIGARTTESQVHRELASGLSMPVGFKNGTDGSIRIAIDAITAASQPHHFLSVTKQGISAIVSTEGNRNCHLILRGSSQGPNYAAASVAKVREDLELQGLAGRVMVDCSHGNSRKDFHRQPLVADDLAAQISAGSSAIAGIMLESNIHEGNQSEPVEYGVSITDACISWETTVEVLHKLAAAVQARRDGTGQ